MTLRQWSTTASGNASVAGINFAEGQAPSTVNNSAREAMAQIRETYQPAEAQWIGFSGTASIASQTTFKVTGDQTTDFHADRRMRFTGGSTTRYATIVSVSFTAETTVTVTVDSGSLSASHSIVWLSALAKDNEALPRGVFAKLSETNTFSATVHFNSGAQFGSSISVSGSVNVSNRIVANGQFVSVFNTTNQGNLDQSGTASLATVLIVGGSATFSASVHMAASLDVSATLSVGSAIIGGQPAVAHTEWSLGALAASTLYTQAHGAGAVPKVILGFLQCTTTEFGYSVGDRLAVKSQADGDGRGLSVFADSTNIYLRSPASIIRVPRLDTTATSPLTAGNWDVYLAMLD